MKSSIKRKAMNPAFRPRSATLALETRTLFDGAIAAGAEQVAENIEPAHHTSDAADNHDSVEPAIALESSDSGRREILFVDTSVTDWQTIVSNVRGDIEVVLLDPGTDALTQIAAALGNGEKTDAIHIVSYGSEGSLQLGGTSISLDTLPGQASQLASIGAGLTADADILLYGCNIASGSAGAAFLDALAQATNADIAASTDTTGAQARGGDWQLERQAGTIETTSIEAEAFDGLLDAPTVSTTASSITVIEPSPINADANASSASLSGWSIGDDGVDSTTVTANVTVADTAKGSLSDPGGSGTAVLDGFSYSGTPVDVQNWVNQLVFTAADVELGNTAATTTITVHVTDGETLPLSASATLAVIITPSNDPVSVADGSQTIIEGSSGTVITAATLAAIDPEVSVGTQNASQIIYRLTDQPEYGYLTLSGTRIGVGSVFTQAQVVAGYLRYVHTEAGSANQNAADSFSVSVNDGATPQASSDTATVTLNITPVNQPPTVSGGGSIFEGQPSNALSNGAAQSIVGNFINASGGGDPGDSTLDLSIVSLPEHGTLHFNGTAIINGVSQTINRALTAADLSGTGFVIAYASRSGLTYSNDGLDPTGTPPNDGFNVKVTDGGGGLGIGAALTSAETRISLNIRAVNDDPVWVEASTLTASVTASGPNGVDDNGGDDYRVVLTPAMLQASDVDSAETEISFVLTEAPADGNLLRNGAVLQVGSTFSMADVRSGAVQYVQTAANVSGANPTDLFKFQIRDNALSLKWDATTGEDYERTGGVYENDSANAALRTFTFNVNLAETPDAPASDPGTGTVITTPAPSTTITTDYVGLPGTGDPISALEEGGSVVLTNAMLSYTSTGVPATQIVYSIKSFDGVAGGWNGSLQKSGVSLFNYDTFTQDDINEGRITFVHDGGEDFASTITFQISAGGLSGSGAPLVTDDVVFNFYITPVNDTPTASGSSNTLITEGSTVAITTSKLAFGDPDDATSEDYLENDPSIGDNYQDNFALNNGVFSADPLRFYISALPVAGKLQYDTVGNGTGWTDITQADVDAKTLYNVSILTADSNTTRLRYVHDGLEVRSDSFQAKSVDRRGAESLSAATVSIVVTNVNDTPEIARTADSTDPTAAGRAANNIGGAPANEPLTVVEEGGFSQITTAMLQAYDPDSTADQVQYRITTAPTHGRMAYSADGITFTTIGTGSSFSQAQVAAGQIYYINDGSEPGSTGYPNTPDDKLVFTLADGDKEQTGNEFWVYVKPTNDAPTVTAPSGPIRLDSASAANNPVSGFSVSDTDLTNIASVETDFLQVTVRLLKNDGTAFSAGDYATASLDIAAGSGVTVDSDKNGNADYLTIRGTRDQVNAALTGLKVTFSDDRDAIYRVQVIADDRVRDVTSGALIDADVDTAGTQAKANGGTLNQTQTPPGAPTAIPATEYDWYSATVPSNDPNIAAKSVTVWASSDNDPHTLSVPAAQTPYEDTAFTFSSARGNKITIFDDESDTFGLDVRLTLSVSNGTLNTAGGSGVVVDGNNTSTMTLTGTATAIQSLLDAGFSYTGNSNYNGTDTLTVTFDEHEAAVGGDTGSGSVKNANLVQTVALDLIAVNDAPTVSAGNGNLGIPGNSPVAVTGVTIGDAADSPLTDAGETDFIQVTVRLIGATDDAPVSDLSAVTFSYDTTAGATRDSTYDGVNTALVLRGTLSQVQNALQDGKLTVSFTGDQDTTYRVQVIADDRLRDANGVLIDSDSGTAGVQASANGGAFNQLDGLPAVPSTDTFNPLSTSYALIGNNTAAATRTVFASSENDAPVNALPGSLTVSEDSTNYAVSGFSISDADDFGANFTVVLTPTNGSLSFSSTTSGVTRVGSGTNASPFTLTGSKTAINTELDKLRFSPTPNLHGAQGIASITMQTTDTALVGSGGGNLTDTDRLDIAITSVNDRPVATKNVTLGAVTEDTSPSGAVFSALDFGYSDATDTQTGTTNTLPDPDVSGGDTATTFSYIAIVGDINYEAAQGQWQVSDGAGGWITVNDSGYSASSALIFRSDREIRFVPAADFHGTPGTLIVRLADNSATPSLSANASDTKNLTSNGGTVATGAWNNTDRNIGTTVSNVNDRPTATATTLTATTEDNTDPTGASVSSLGFGYSDATDNKTAITGGANAATAFGGIAIVGNAADAGTQGVWQYNTGSGWVAIGSPSDSSAILLPTSASLRFLPNVENFNGTPGALTVRVSDATVSFNASSNISGSLGQTSQWSDTTTLATSITKQNDAPTIGGTVAAKNPDAPENNSTGSGLSVDPVSLLTGAATLSDIDLSTTSGLDANIFGAGTITVTLSDGISGDQIFVNGGALAGISTTAGGTGSAPLVITLANTATRTQVEAILAALQYKSSSDNPTVNNTDTTRSYTIDVSDGNNQQAGGNAGGPSALSATHITGTITITPTNDAPVVDLNGTTTAGENHAVTWNEAANATHVAVNIAPNATLSDADNTQLTQMTLTVGGVLDGNSEVLTIGGTAFALGTTASNVDIGAFLVSYNNSTGVFTITPDSSTVAMLSSFQSLLQGTTYNNSTDNPTAGSRTIDVKVTDAGHDDAGGTDQLNSNLPRTTITVVPTNDQPVITGLGPLTVFENAVNASPATIDSNITLTDIDSADYDGGTLTVSGLVASQDVVSLPTGAAATSGNVQINGSNVEYHDGSNWVDIGTHSGGNGSNFVVSFNASATTEIVERVVESLTYANTSDAPTTTRTLTIGINDGDGNAVQNATTLVTVVRDNDAPTMSATTLGGTYTENATALAFVSGTISLSDPDAPANFFSGGAGNLLVALDHYVAGDQLSVLNQGTGTGQIGVSGTTISYGGTAFATTSGGNGSNLTITFTSTAATPAAVQALLGSLRYSSTSDDPTVNETDESRNFTVTFRDGANTKDTSSPTGELTAQLNGTIAVEPAQDAPVLGGAGNPHDFTENSAAVTLEPDLTLNDVDDTQMGGATVTISSGLTTGDVLAANTVGTNISALYSGGTLTLTGTDSKENYERVLRSVTFANTSEDPTDGNNTSRTISWQVTDANSDLAGAASSNQPTTTVTITPLTDAPTFSAAPVTATAWTENTAAVAVDDNFTVSDADDTAFASATVTISGGFTAGDVLAVTDQGSVSGTYRADTRTLSLTGGTIDDLTAVLKTLTFESTSDDPTANTTAPARTLTYSVTDANSDGAGAGTSTTTRTVNVSPAQDAPVLGVTSTGNGFTENGTPVKLASAVAIVDDDDTDMNGATVRISAGLTTGDVLAATTTGSISAAYDAGTGILTLTGTDTIANYLSVLQSVTFISTSEDPTATSATRTITWQVTDANSDLAGAASSNQPTTTVNVTALNDAPAGADKTLVTDEDVPVTITAADFGFSDVDVGGPDGDFKAVRIDALPGVGTLLLNGVPVADGQVISRADVDAGLLRYAPPENASGIDHARFEFSVQDGGDLFDPAPNVIQFNITPVSDAPALTTATADGSILPYGYPIPLSIDIAATDTVGTPETLAIRISAIPPGATLSNAAGDVLTVTDGSITLTPEQLAGLEILIAPTQQTDFSLEVVGISTDDTAAPATTPGSLLVKIPLLPPTNAPGSIELSVASERGSINLPYTTHMPHIWEYGGSFNRIINLPIPQQPAVFVEITVQHEHSMRDEADALAEGSDVSAVLPREASISPSGSRLGFDPSIFVRPAVLAAESARMYLQGVVLGRDGRTSLSTDSLLTHQGIFAPNPAAEMGMLLESADDSAAAAKDQAEADTIAVAAPQPAAIDAKPTESSFRGATAFSEQLRNAQKSGLRAGNGRDAAERSGKDAGVPRSPFKSASATAKHNATI